MQTFRRATRTRYGDRGALLCAIGQYNESLPSLNESLNLYRSDAANPGAIAATLITLARVDIALKDTAGAQTKLEEAMLRARELRANNPLRAAFIEESYGDYLALKRQWSAARAQYLDSISLLRAQEESKEQLSTSLLAAATADDHLHEKGEAKAFRKQAQFLLTRSRTPGAGSTVDLTILEASAQRH